MVSKLILIFQHLAQLASYEGEYFRLYENSIK